MQGRLCIFVYLSIDIHMKYWFRATHGRNLHWSYQISYVTFGSFYLPSAFKILTFILCVSNHCFVHTCVIFKNNKHIPLFYPTQWWKGQIWEVCTEAFDTLLEPAHKSRPTRTSIVLSSVLIHVPGIYRATHQCQIPSVFSRSI